MRDNPPTGTPDPPYIAASTHLPEITVKAIILGIVLAALLGGANAYLGLLAGMTVSASIPAAVISMAILRLFRTSNILENNIVQTAASAGESLAAGVIFTFPALIIMGTWEHFSYIETTVIAALGGLIGVLFTIPLRRALIVGTSLGFPEGLATAEVLKVGDNAGAGSGGGLGAILGGGVIGALFKFGESGLALWPGTAEVAGRVGLSATADGAARGTVAYAGSNLYPSLVGVGYIVGLNIAVLVFLGGAINWYIAIPILASMDAWPVNADGEAMAAADYGWQLWSTQTRYLGVGAMVVGGLWALVRLARPLIDGITASFSAYRDAASGEGIRPLRTEDDTSIKVVMILLALSVIPIFFVYYRITDDVGVSLLMAVIMLVAGFFFSAVAAYMAGLVGSSNNPISGVTIATILGAALLLVMLVGKDSTIGAAAAVMIGSVVCCAAAIGGDNMQDLKAGHILGATPRKQQIMQAIGVLSAAVVMAPILNLLLNAYGIGEPASPDREALQAPQATLMASVADGVFGAGLPWAMIGIGAGIAAVIIILDLILEARQARFRMPVLAVAVGIYLPLELAVPIFFGGLIAYFAKRVHVRLARRRGEDEESAGRGPLQSGLLFCAGLITGEALLGIMLAIPIVANEGENPISLSVSWGPLPPIALMIGLMVILWTVAARKSVE